MSDWQTRIFRNDNVTYPVSGLPDEFLATIRDSQIAANKGWAPDMTDLIDYRVANCPECKAPGMNTCWGYWAFTCGAKILADGDASEPCGYLPSPSEG